jgi:methylase of polypeptide subunit release factors
MWFIMRQGRDVALNVRHLSPERLCERRFCIILLQMRHLYYANFVSGLQGVIADILTREARDLVIKKELDGALLFETACPHERLNGLCFNNLFSVIHLLERPAVRAPLEAHLRAVCGQPMRLAPLSGRPPRTFRIVTSYANRLTAVSDALKRRAEFHVTRQTGLSLSRSKADAEFWFLYRTEGFSLFMQRLSFHASFDKTLHKGELTPPLAYALCALARPAKGAVVLDPFCGYGAIPRACLAHFPIRTCYAFDINDEALAYTRRSLKDASHDAVVRKLDVYALPSVIPSERVDAIITDPPWGCYERLPTPRFYADILRLFGQALKPGGTLTLLTAQTDIVASIIEELEAMFALEKSIAVLVSGKKAGVFKLVKRADV